MSRFKKYQWIEVEIEKNTSDKRVDSYRPKVDSIKIISNPLPAGKWEERKKIVLPTLSNSIEEMGELYDKYGISLGLIKPHKVSKFVIETTASSWSSKHEQILSQQVLFGDQPKELEKIPYKFSYVFSCKDDRCKEHKLQIYDWEINELYRNIRKREPYAMDSILQKVKQKWFDDMWSESRDTYLIVGTTYPFKSYEVIGVFWPPK